MDWATECETEGAESGAASYAELQNDLREWLNKAFTIVQRDGLRCLYLFADVLYGSFDAVLHDDQPDAPGKGIVVMQCPWLEEKYLTTTPEPEEPCYDEAHAAFFDNVVKRVRGALPDDKPDVELTVAKGVRLA